MTQLTHRDLQQFKKELLQSIGELFKTIMQTPPSKLLKSYEVMRMLRVSPATLARMRASGKLPFTKFGHILYYEREDILKLMEQSKSNAFK